MIYIYLIFSKTGTWLSKAINVFVETKYIHSSISFDNSFKAMYSFGRINPNNPFSGGLVEESIYEGVYRKFHRCECVIYKVKVTKEQLDTLRSELDSFLRDKDKYRYNFIGLFGVLINRPLRRKNHYFCSQFVSELLIKSSIFYSDKIPELIGPMDLLELENKEKIYEGLTKEYCM